MATNWLDDDARLLGGDFPLLLQIPFTARQAYDEGVSRRMLERLVRDGFLRRVLRGVYIGTQSPDDLLTRTTALGLVVPPTAVVCDRTAAWLHGVDILPRSAVTVVPPLDVAHVDDTRVRRDAVDGRRRGLLPSDITVVHGILVTTALRTALDLGRLLWRHDALAALDGFLRIGVPHEVMAVEVGRFRGFRGVRQLRALVPLADPRSESVPEAGLRLHWHDAGLPWPHPQLWVYDARGVGLFRLDVADPVVRYAAEYDGEGFHTDDADVANDEERRRWLAEHEHWTIDVFTKEDLYVRGTDPRPRLLNGYARARRNMALWTPSRRTA